MSSPYLIWTKLIDASKQHSHAIINTIYYWKTLTSMARKTVADIPSATWYSFLSFTCVTLFSNDVVNILKIYQTPQKSEYAKLSILYIKTIMKMWLASIALNKFLSYKMHMFVMFVNFLHCLFWLCSLIFYISISYFNRCMFSVGALLWRCKANDKQSA